MEKVELKGEAIEEENSMKLNGLKYDIIKIDEGIKIKLSEPKGGIYYEYEASKTKLKEDIQILLNCENINDMFSTIKSIFDEGRVKFFEENNKYYIELYFETTGQYKNYKIELNKHDYISELNNKINIIEKDIKNIYKEIEIIKTNKIKEEILKDKDLKIKLYEEFEQMMCSKYNINQEQKEQNNNLNKKVKVINKNMNNKTSEELLKEFNIKYKLNIPDTNITKINLYNKNLGDEGIKDLIKIEFKELKHLDLRTNNISDIKVLDKLNLIN